MPKLPTYDGSQVETAALPGFRQSSVASAGLFNAGNEGLDQMGRGMQALGQEMVQQQVEQQKLRDMDMVNRAELAFAQQEQDYLSELSKRQGMNAWGATKDTESWAKDRFKEHSGMLENDTQRRAFEARFAERAIRVRGIAMDHENKQQKASYLESRTAQVGQAISDAAADPGKLAESKARIDGVLGDLGKFHGWDAETAKAKRLETTTQLHTQVIQALGMKSPEAAMAYFKEHKDEIDGTRHAELGKALEANERDSKLQTYVDETMGLGLTEAQAIEKARKDHSGKDEDEAVARVKERYGEKDAAKKAADDEVLNPIRTTLGDAIQKGRIIPKAEQDVMLREIRLSNPALYERAAREIHAHNKQLEAEYKAARASAADVPGGKALNWATLKYDMINHPDKWRNVDLSQVLKPMVEAGQLGANHFEEAITVQQNLKKPGKETEYTLLASGDEYLRDRLMGSKVDGKDFAELKPKEQQAIVAQARQAIDPLLTKYQTDKGGKASPEELRGVIDSAFITQKFRKTVFGVRHGAAYDVTTLDTAGAAARAPAVARTSQVPSSVRTKIEAALRKNGEAVTEENILAYFNARPN